MQVYLQTAIITLPPALAEQMLAGMKDNDFYGRVYNPTYDVIPFDGETFFVLKGKATTDAWMGLLHQVYALLGSLNRKGATVGG
jgi:hypothetical protein